MAKDNGLTGQIRGPFLANENLISLIANENSSTNFLLFKIGIIVPLNKEYYIQINNQKILIGRNGILEYNDVNITSLYFLQDVSSSTIIDYACKL